MIEPVHPALEAFTIYLPADLSKEMFSAQYTVNLYSIRLEVEATAVDAPLNRIASLVFL